MLRLTYLLITGWTIISLSSCDVTDNKVEPGVSFTQIYDDRSFEADYDPLDLVQTDDGGYLSLAATHAWNIYLFHTDADGQFTWEIKVDEAYVNPLEQLVRLDDQYYVFGMNEVTRATVILQLNFAERTATPVAELGEIQYPLAVTVTPDQSLLVLGYERESRSSTLHKLNADFSVAWDQAYAVEEDMEEAIVRHLSRTGRRLPFFVGYTDGGQSYYFNGLANYTLSLNFVDPQNGDLRGTLNGFRADEFVSAAYHLQGQQYALARSSFGVSTLLPRTEVEAQTVGSSSELIANDFPEIDHHARIVVKEVTLATRSFIVFGTHTKQRQLILYAYDKESGALRGTQYLGQTSPYQLGNFIVTEDGGMAVLAETQVAGRFSRPCLFKLSPQEVRHFIR